MRNLWQGTNGAKAKILEFDAGAKFTSLDTHSPGTEEVFVVSGIFNDGVHDYPAGSFIHNPCLLGTCSSIKAGLRDFRVLS